jgi:hypothetical protein
MKALLKKTMGSLVLGAGLFAVGAGCSSANSSAVFTGAYTGTVSLKASDAKNTATGSGSETWTLTQEGSDVSFNFPTCPGLSGTANGDVAVVNATDCPPISNGSVTNYTGGSVAVSGDSLAVDMAVSVVLPSGETLTGTITGTLTKGLGSGSGSGSSDSSSSPSSGSKANPCGGGCHGCSTCTASGCQSCPVGEEGICTC